MMLFKETSALQSQKDLFLIIVNAFKKDASRLSEISLAEVTEHLFYNVSDVMINAHHQQVVVWNNLVNSVGLWFPSGEGVLSRLEKLDDK